MQCNVCEHIWLRTQCESVKYRIRGAGSRQMARMDRRSEVKVVCLQLTFKGNFLMESDCIPVQMLGMAAENAQS